MAEGKTARRRTANAAGHHTLQFTIRPAVASDTAALTALLHATFIETWAPQMSAEALAAWRLRESPARYVHDKIAAFVIAESHGALAGMIHWNAGFVHALHVDRACRRQGIGAALMAKAERAARADGQSEMRLETDTFNSGSQALYRSLGYREVDRYPDQEHDSRIVTLLLEKPR